MKAVLCLSVFLVSMSAAAQQWVKLDKIDDFTDEVTRAAIWEDDTHRLQISMDDVTVMGKSSRHLRLYLSLKGIPSFAIDTPLELRVDKRETHTIEEIDMFPHIYQWSPGTLVVALGFHDKSARCGPFVDDIATGEVLRGRYHVSKTERETFTVTLAGLSKILGELFELPCAEGVEAKPLTVEQQVELLGREKMLGCGSNIECIQAYSVCLDEKSDEERLACLQSTQWP